LEIVLKPLFNPDSVVSTENDHGSDYALIISTTDLYAASVGLICLLVYFYEK